MPHRAAFVVTLAASVASAQQPPARQVERLDRAVIALPLGNGKGVYVGWRMLGTDPDDVAFDVYRKVGDAPLTKLNREPIASSTNLVDEAAPVGSAYVVRPVNIAGSESAEIAAVEPKPYLSIPLRTPEGYQPNDASCGDLDGDGRYELVVKQLGRAKDNSQAGVTDPTLLQAYALDGRFLWQVDLGPNVRSGAHYAQFMIYDFDGDGRAEVMCKTADGTRDGLGKTLGDARARHANDSGYVLRGPEFLTVFDGRTGGAVDTVPYAPGRFPGKDDPSGDELKRFWGDGYGNRSDRFLAGVAYLDGERPSAVFARGYYTRSFVAAWDFDGRKLKQRWLFDSEDPKCVGASAGKSYSGQGFHSLSVADVDADGRDEIVYGAMTIDDDGRGLYTTGLGHGDALHVGDLDPGRPGLEVFGIQERFDDAGMHLTDARTGATIWKRPSVRADASGDDKGEGPMRGVAFNVDATHAGSECWAFGAGMSGVWNARGERVSDATPPSCNFAVWWDGDLLRELLDKNEVTKWDPATGRANVVFRADGCRANNGTKATPALTADLLGDWREEIVLATEDGKELRVFTTTTPTPHRLRTLMHDTQYRVAVAWQNTAYNQPPHPSFDVDPAMGVVPRPRVRVVPARTSPREPRP